MNPADEASRTFLRNTRSVTIALQNMAISMNFLSIAFTLRSRSFLPFLARVVPFWYLDLKARYQLEERPNAGNRETDKARR